MAKQSRCGRRLGFLLPRLFLSKLFFSKLSLLELFLGIAVLNAVSVFPAKAEALRDLTYDAQTRSLILVLPDTITPTVSVIAPNQLLLELPDTQVGDVMGQTVQDGMVEGITIEQATPETVWVVMEFVPGTVLSNAQAAVPLADTQSGDQQWQVRPALIVASRDANQEASQEASQEATQEASQGSAQEILLADDVAAVSTSASSLQIPASEISQLPDFSELPVLEPSVPLNQPVSVPPLNTASPAILPSPLPAPAADSTSLGEPPLETSSQAADTETPEPPFVSDIGTDAVDTDRGTSSAETALVEAVPDDSETITDDPTSAIPTLDRIASEPDTSEITTELESITDDQATDNQAAAEPFADETERPSSPSRWPEPIPFGQPLPR